MVQLVEQTKEADETEEAKDVARLGAFLSAVITKKPSDRLWYIFVHVVYNVVCARLLRCVRGL